eukprot:TRINITY_DN7476_c0_g2_i1.p1 TRINITY_DN7476_c0_g2~~TRINITY_DN7476_c0_g2_i1.p1  ORF type:complete len:456 (-),score=103.63 TRINITY_DN7476_c0_g2_i1:250-1617(-)
MQGDERWPLSPLRVVRCADGVGVSDDCSSTSTPLRRRGMRCCLQAGCGAAGAMGLLSLRGIAPGLSFMPGSVATQSMHVGQLTERTRPQQELRVHRSTLAAAAPATATQGHRRLASVPTSALVAGGAAAAAAASQKRAQKHARRSSAVIKEPTGDDPLAKLGTGFWRFVILLLCMLWATNFAIIKEITAQPGMSTQLYAVARFTLAAVSMLPAVVKISSAKIAKRAAVCGAWVAFGYLCQAIGLMTTTAAKSCFICCLNVVFVSLLSGMKKGFDPRTVAAAVIAVAGVGFLELAGSQSFVIGDLISLGQPIGFGLGYVKLEEIMEDSPNDAGAVTSIKLIMVAIASWLYFTISNGALPDFAPVLASSTAMYGILWCGLITTSLSLLVESVAFRYVDATSASVIFTTEPLWAALFAVWLISEPCSAADCVGGALVILANAVKGMPSSMLPKFMRKN